MDTRVQELELQVFDLQSEVASLREELANMAEIASMAVGEAQQAALRMDRMEQEWQSWWDTAPEGGSPPQQPGPPGGTHPPQWVALSPSVTTPQSLSPRTPEGATEAYLQRPLL